ncbi:MAG: VOC family protein [Deltaproteobacteria bacterium]|nr:VOC family protein [Deltaproteobacteria bacterium]
MSNDNKTVEPYTHGKFVWFELVTREVEKAKAYYSELFGWKAKTEQMGPMTYTMLSVGERGIGGIVSPPDAQIPSHWNNYITVPDVTAYAKKAEAAGGKVLMPEQTIPEGGTFCLLADPAGATFSIWRSAKPNTEPERDPELGDLCWFELMTTDIEKAKSFYGELFNWKFEKGPMGEMEYWIAKRGDKMTCGITTLPEQAKQAGAPPHWLSYVAVENLEQTNARADKQGGTSLFGPMEIPNIGKFSIYQGPEGGVLAHFQGQPQ